MNRILPFLRPAPRPILTRVARLRGVTGILRIWRPEDVGRCKLCEYCSAEAATCLVLTNVGVDPERAATFSTRGMTDPARRREGRSG